MLLNDAGMKGIGTSAPNKFGEDMQTLYIKNLAPAGTHQQAWQGATVIYGGHRGVTNGSTPVGSGTDAPYEHCYLQLGHC